MRKLNEVHAPDTSNYGRVLREANQPGTSSYQAVREAFGDTLPEVPQADAMDAAPEDAEPDDIGTQVLDLVNDPVMSIDDKLTAIKAILVHGQAGMLVAEAFRGEHSTSYETAKRRGNFDRTPRTSSAPASLFTR